MQTKTIFFDFGKTIHPYTVDSFFQWLSGIYGIPRRHFWPLFSDYPDGLIFRYELGQPTAEFFHAFRTAVMTLVGTIYQGETPLKIPDFEEEEFKKHWNAMLDPSPPLPDRLRLISKLHARGYRLFIISNTTQMHRDYILHANRFQKLLFYFERFIASCDPDIRCRKTRLRQDKSNKDECEEIFCKALAIAGSTPEESVLIDGFREFVEVFWQMGGQGIHHRESWTQIESELYKLGVRWE